MSAVASLSASETSVLELSSEAVSQVSSSRQIDTTLQADLDGRIWQHHGDDSPSALQMNYDDLDEDLRLHERARRGDRGPPVRCDGSDGSSSMTWEPEHPECAGECSSAWRVPRLLEPGKFKRKIRKS